MYLTRAQGANFLARDYRQWPESLPVCLQASMLSDLTLLDSSLSFTGPKIRHVVINHHAVVANRRPGHGPQGFSAVL
jgi:hypothetical protein